MAYDEEQTTCNNEWIDKGTRCTRQALEGRLIGESSKLLSQSDHFGGGYFDDKKIRVGDSGGGPDDNDIWTKTAALDLMTQERHRIKPHLAW